VHLIGINMSNNDIVQSSNEMYRLLNEEGIETLFDDRANVSPGFKFKDADLLGMPIQVIVGEKGLKNNQVEIKVRRTGERSMIARGELLPTIKAMLSA
jgi:prolyl-tRNA synthetase